MSESDIRQAFARWLCETGQVSARSAEAACQKAAVRRLSRDEPLFCAGDRPRDLFFIQSGLVRFFYLTADGKEFNKNFVSSGSVVTSLSTFLSGIPSPFHTQALEPTLVVALPMDFVRERIDSDLDWERLVHRFVVALALKKERREASFLLQDAGERYEAFLGEFSGIAPRLPQYHIASYLGITPVALSRIRARRTVSRVS